MKAKAVLPLLVGLLPASETKNRLLNRLGHEVDASAIVGPTLLLNVGTFRVGARTRMRSGNSFRNVKLVDIGADTHFGPYNNVWANPIFRRTADLPEYAGIFSVGACSFISKRHTVDCSGGFFMGEWSGLTGRQVQVYSHSYDPRRDMMACAPTRVGVGSMVATKTTLSMGASLPDRCVLAMGGVLMPGATETEAMYGGVPAKPIRSGIGDWRMFHREVVLPSYDRKPDFVSTPPSPLPPPPAS